jgi:hypothetical protein
MDRKLNEDPRLQALHTKKWIFIKIINGNWLFTNALRVSLSD